METLYVYRRGLTESKSVQGVENRIKHGEITVNVSRIVFREHVRSAKY
jgi:hypothetical protein